MSEPRASNEQWFARAAWACVVVVSVGRIFGLAHDIAAYGMSAAAFFMAAAIRERGSR